MEKWIYWLRRIIKKRWKECKSFCVICEYYQDCKNDIGDLINDSKLNLREELQKENSDFRDESETIVM